MNADEIRKLSMCRVTDIVNNELGTSQQSREQFAVTREIAAQLAELNTHLERLASVVQPGGKKWPTHIIFGRADWNPDSDLDAPASDTVEPS